MYYQCASQKARPRLALNTRLIDESPSCMFHCHACLCSDIWTYRGHEVRKNRPRKVQTVESIPCVFDAQLHYLSGRSPLDSVHDIQTHRDANLTLFPRAPRILEEAKV